MKFSLALFGLAAAIALPTTGSAANLTWTFLNNSSVGGAINSPASFTDIQGDPTTITASIVTPALTSYQLFEKNNGGDESGLGIARLLDNEIGTNSIVKVDLSNLLALNPTSVSITLESNTDGEAGIVEYGNTTTGELTISNENAHALNVAALTAAGGYIEVHASGPEDANILIGNIAATTPDPTPEPANAALVGFGLLAASGCLIRRRFAKQNS